MSFLSLKEISFLTKTLWWLLLSGQNQGLTREEIERAGTGVGFTPSELNTLEREDLEAAILYLGRDKMSIDQAESVWKALLRAYGDAANVPDSVLQQMGWVMRGIPPEDIGNLSLKELDTIAAFGKYHDFNNNQIAALAEQLRFTWTAKDPEDYTYYDLRAMQHILCGFNRSEIERIHPMAYKQAADSLGQLMNCSRAVLQALAMLALDSSAFGNPATWTTTQVNTIGCVLGGLDDYSFSSIPSSSLQHLPTNALKCIPIRLRKLSSLKLPQESQEKANKNKELHDEEYVLEAGNETDKIHNTGYEARSISRPLIILISMLHFKTPELYIKGLLGKNLE